MAYEDKVEGYAFFMLFFQLSLTLLSVAGLDFMHLEIVGFDVTGMMTSSLNNFTNLISDFTSNSGLWDYATAIMLLLWNGVKIVFSFVLMVLTGLKPLAQLFGIHPLIYTPLIGVIDLVIMYSVGKLLLGLSR